MPRYFFHLHDGHVVIDNVGSELPDLEAARVEATRFAGHMLRDYASEFAQHSGWFVEVTDESGLMLFTLNIEIVVPSESAYRRSRDAPPIVPRNGNGGVG